MTDQQPIIARFRITGWEETDLPGLPEGAASGVKMTKEFTEGIAGGSEGLFISSGTEEGSRSYVAVERITGTLPDGRKGGFSVHHGGLESSPETWFGHIVPGTGDGDLAGVAGSAKIGHDERGAFFTIELEG
jgi:hypothetical protein